MGSPSTDGDERITLWHLLTHRSGLFDCMWDGRGTAYGHGGAMAGYTVQLRATRDGEHVVIAVANSHRHSRKRLR